MSFQNETYCCQNYKYSCRYDNYSRTNNNTYNLRLFYVFIFKVFAKCMDVCLPSERGRAEICNSARPLWVFCFRPGNYVFAASTRQLSEPLL